MPHSHFIKLAQSRFILRGALFLALQASAFSVLAYADCNTACTEGFVEKTFTLRGNPCGLLVTMTGSDAVGPKSGQTKLAVKLKPEKEYTFDLTNSAYAASPCGIGSLRIGCGLEFKLIDYVPPFGSTGPIYGDNWVRGNSFCVHNIMSDNDSAPIPTSFKVRLTKPESDENTSSLEGSSDSSLSSKSPSYDQDPDHPELASLSPASANLSIRTGAIGMGTGGTAPYRSAGLFFWSGPLAGGLASPTHLEHLAISEVEAHLGVSWLDVAPVSGGAVERHFVTPTRLFRVTGFSSTDPDAVVDYNTATSTYIREYSRATGSENLLVTLGRPAISWYKITPNTSTGLKMEKSVNGFFSSTSLVAPSPNELVTDDGLNKTEWSVGGLSGGTYTEEKICKRSDVIVSREQSDYMVIEGRTQVIEERRYPDPAIRTVFLRTSYDYYHSGVDLPEGTEPGSLRWVSNSDGSWQFYRYGTGDTEVFSPYMSETALDTDCTNQLTLPIAVSGGSGRYKRTISEETYSYEYVGSDLSGSGEGDFLVAQSGRVGGDPGGAPVENLGGGLDAVLPDGIDLVTSYQETRYSDGIDSASADRWLAGQPVLTWDDDRLAHFHEYSKSGGIITKTVTSGTISWDGSTLGKRVGSAYFQEISGRSDRVISIYGPQGLISKELLYETGSGFTSASVEVLTYNADGSYASTTTNGVVTDRVEYIDAYTTVHTDSTGIKITRVVNSQGETVSLSVAAGGGVPAQVTTSERNGLTTTTWLNGVSISETIVDGLGRTASTKDAKGIIKTYSYGDLTGRGNSTTESSPGGIYRLTENYSDGRIKSVSGTGVVPEFYSYEINPEPYNYHVSILHSTGSSTEHTVRKAIEQFNVGEGRLIKVIKPSPSGGMVETEYSASGGKVFAETTSAQGESPAMLSRRLYAPSLAAMAEAALGFETFVGFDMDDDSKLTFGSADRFTKQEWFYIVEGGKVFRKTLVHQYPDGIEANRVTTETRERLSFVTNGTGSYINWGKVIDPSGRAVTTTTTVDPTHATVVTVRDDSATTGIDSTTTTINGYVSSIQEVGFAKSETFQYDTLGRLIKTTDSRGASSRTINNNFQVDKTVDHLGRETSYVYYPANVANAGKIQKVIHPGSAETETIYNSHGQIQEIKGSAEYRQIYGYDEYGDKTSLQTFKADLPTFTRWIYQPSTGLLSGKRYNDGSPTESGSGVGYDLEYTTDGKVFKRTTAKGVKTKYTYDPLTRDLATVSYQGDGALTPSVEYSQYDHFGRPGKVTETLGSTVNIQTLSYQPHSGAVSTTYDATHRWLPSVSIENSADDSVGRPAGFQVKLSGVTKAIQTYQYDTLSRLYTVSSEDLTAELSYLDGTGILRQQTVKAGAQIIHDRRLAIDMLGRVAGVENRAPSSGLGTSLLTVASVGHGYDSAGRRKNANREDGTVWDYSYNDRSEVRTAIKKNASGVTVPGLGFSYDYDGIGNRIVASAGSDLHVANLSYIPNELNQYANLSHSGGLWALVRSDAAVTASATTGGATISASIGSVTQVGNFYGAKISVTDGNGAGLITSHFVRGGVAIAGSLETWMPSASYDPNYDLDGNLTNDGRWAYTWDGRNYLVSMIPTTTAILNGAPNVEVYFSYDYAGRRLGKSVVDKRVTPFIIRNISYAYDGWNPVAQWERGDLTSAPILKHTNLWGIDVGSSGKADSRGQAAFQQAGGVGGLIASTYHNSTTSRESFLPGYDANGNIISWTTKDGGLIQKIDYDAFGNDVIVENFGDVAKLPEFGFSTKINDAETGLSYYGYRFYDPKTGKWPSRDPMEEAGGVNLYAFVRNRAIDSIDVLGCLMYTEVDNEGYRNKIREGLQDIAGGSLCWSQVGTQKKWDLLICRKGSGKFWKDLTPAFTDSISIKYVRTEMTNNAEGSWIKGELSINENVDVNLPELDSPESEKTSFNTPPPFTYRKVNFRVVLWHELVGHMLTGSQINEIEHPRVGWNRYGDGFQDGRDALWGKKSDRVIYIENEARGKLKYKPRAPWYYGYEGY